jgi:hypothetical protein
MKSTIIAATFSQSLAANKKLLPAYVGRDTLIEDNEVADAAVGIRVDRYWLDTLIRNNRFRNCNTNLLNQGTNTLTTEQN